MNPASDAVRFVIDAFNELGIECIITGSIVASAYGEPRMSIDAVFVVHTSEERLSTLASRLASEFEREPQITFETVTGRTQHKFRHRGSKFLIEIFERSEDPHDEARFERRKKVRFLGRDVFFPTVEDAIVTKLFWIMRIHRVKDIDDVRNMIARQNDAIDWAYVEGWCRRHGSADWLERIRFEAIGG